MYVNNSFPNVMTVIEVAEFLRIGRTTAYELVRTGEIPSVKVGRQIRVFREDLLDYVRFNRGLEE